MQCLQDTRQKNQGTTRESADTDHRSSPTHTHTHAKTFGVDQMAVRFGVGLGVVCVVVGSCELEVRPELVLHSEENNFSE